MRIEMARVRPGGSHLLFADIAEASDRQARIKTIAGLLEKQGAVRHCWTCWGFAPNAGISRDKLHALLDPHLGNNDVVTYLEALRAEYCLFHAPVSGTQLPWGR